MARSKAEARQAVLENTISIPESGCWVYMGSVNWFGAPNHVKYDGGRIAPPRLVMDAKPGEVVCHHCDVPSCVRPDHLYIGTHKTNRWDRVRRNPDPPHRKITGDQLQVILESPLPSTRLAKVIGLSAGRIRAIRVAHNQHRKAGRPPQPIPTTSEH